MGELRSYAIMMLVLATIIGLGSPFFVDFEIAQNHNMTAFSSLNNTVYTNARIQSNTILENTTSQARAGSNQQNANLLSIASSFLSSGIGIAETLISLPITIASIAIGANDILYQATGTGIPPVFIWFIGGLVGITFAFLFAKFLSGRFDL